MNKQLLTALFAATFSGIVFATETPDYHGFPQAAYEYCTAYNTESCRKLVAFGDALFVTLKARQNETGVIGLTKEEQEQAEALKNALLEEIEQFNARKTNLLESAEQKAEKAGEEIAKELNPTDTDSKE